MIEVKQIDRENIQYLVDNLEDFEKDKAIKSGLRSAASIFIRRGKSNLNQRLMGTGKGSLAKSFMIRVKRNKLGSLAGFRRSTKLVQWEKAGNHAHLVDKGTKVRYTTGRKSVRAGISRGVMPNNSFWSDAKASEESKSMNALYQGIQRAVQRINNRS